jgi:hypothetical protein
MKTSPDLKNFAVALAEVQASMKPLRRNADNPFFKSSYTDLAAMAENLYPILAAKGFSVVQGGDGTSLSTLLLHSSGEWVETSLPMPNEPNPQKLGSVITYFRRYALAAIVGATSEGEDDDGNAASHPTARPATSPAPAPRPPAQGETHPTQPAPAAPTKAQSGAGPAALFVKAVDTAKDTKEDPPKWTRWTANFSDGTRASTFSETAGAILTQAKHNGTEVLATFEKKGNFTNILTVEHIDQSVPF